jgi:hypothetical protein
MKLHTRTYICHYSKDLWSSSQALAEFWPDGQPNEQYIGVSAIYQMVVIRITLNKIRKKKSPLGANDLQMYTSLYELVSTMDFER